MEIERYFENRKILITGATGFIGSHLTRRLVKLKAKVNIFVIKNDNKWRIKDISNKINIWEANLTDFNKVSESLQIIKPEIIFHLATLRNVERNIDLIDPSIEINLKGTLNLLKAIVKKNIKLKIFINTGTCEEYGDGPVPFLESQKEMPVSPYSASKTATTYFCQMLQKSFRLPIITLRPFLTYGPAQDTDMFIPALIKHCLEKKDFLMTEGDQTREFNYVEDIVDAYLLSAFTKGIAGEIINIGNGIEYKVRDVAEKIVSLMGNPIKLKVGTLPKRPGEAEHFYCDNTKARKLLNWTPKYNLEEGLKETIAWYKNNYQEMKKYVKQT